MSVRGRRHIPHSEGRLFVFVWKRHFEFAFATKVVRVLLQPPDCSDIYLSVRLSVTISSRKEKRWSAPKSMTDHLLMLSDTPVYLPLAVQVEALMHQVCSTATNGGTTTLAR